MVALAMALGALILGVPPLPEHATPSLAPLVARLLAQTTERPAQQQQQQQEQQAQEEEQQQQADGDVDEGKHPLKKMQKRVLAHEKKMKLEKAQDKMKKVEKAREKNAGKQGEGEHKKKLKKKIKSMEKMKNARTRKDTAAKQHEAEQEETREYTHSLDKTPVQPRQMITLSRGRAGSSVVAQTIAAFSLADAATMNFNPKAFYFDFGMEIFGQNRMQMEQVTDPVKRMVDNYQKQATEQPAAPLLGFKWKPQEPTFNAVYGGAWDWVIANNVSVLWMTRNLLDVRISVAKHNVAPLGSQCKPGDEACVALNQKVRVTLDQLAYKDGPHLENATGLVECLAADQIFYETQLKALLKEKGVRYRLVKFEDLFEPSDRADKRGFYVKLRHNSIDAHKEWNGMFHFLGLPTVDTYAEIVAAADAQMEATTPPTQCDSFVDADAVRAELKGSDFEGLLGKC